MKFKFGQTLQIMNKFRSMKGDAELFVVLRTVPFFVSNFQVSGVYFLWDLANAWQEIAQKPEIAEKSELHSKRFRSQRSNFRESGEIFNLGKVRKI